jgi:hypothetical protein
MAMIPIGGIKLRIGTLAEGYPRTRYKNQLFARFSTPFALILSLSKGRNDLDLKIPSAGSGRTKNTETKGISTF